MSVAPHPFFRADAALPLLIRADASPRMGAGHVMRCLALAGWAAREGCEATLISRAGVPWVAEKVRTEGIAFIPLEGGIPASERPAALLDVLGPASPGAWAVLDGYHFGLDCHKAVRTAGYKLLVIDDYAHLPEYSCDILLNQNIGAEEFTYTGDIGQKLLGPKYALLRPEFAKAREKAQARIFPEKAQKILLTLGGGDFSGHLARIAPDFTIPELAGCILRVIAGAMPHERIHELLRDCPAQVEILGRVDDMPALLLDTDLCVTAGGSTCWELCCLGVPFLTVEVAQNQRALLRHLAESGFAESFAKYSFAAALEGPVAEKSARVMTLVDGKGCGYALATMQSSPEIVLPQSSPEIAPPQSLPEMFPNPAAPEMILRQALPEDCLAVFELANDPLVRANSFSSKPIPWEEHAAWFAKRTMPGGSPFFLAFSGDSLIGYVRYDRPEPFDDFAVSLAVSEAWRGKGLGARLLQETGKLMADRGERRVTAWVRPENAASRNAVLQAGYTLIGLERRQDADMLRFRLETQERVNAFQR